MLLNEEDYLAHYGILRKSGRYPWGSSGSQNVRNRTFLEYVADLRSKGLSESEIARGVGISTTQLRAAKTIAKNQQRQQSINQAKKLKDKGLSNVAIGAKMGVNESQVRALLQPDAALRADILTTTASRLREAVESKTYIDVGKGVENHMGISKEKLSAAVAVLKEEGYDVHYVKVKQLGTGHETSNKVLVAPGTEYITTAKAVREEGLLNQVTTFSNDGGESSFGLKPPLSVNPDRLAVKYGSEGGAKADGVIYIRPGVDDLSLGDSSYAQVRIKVGNKQYLKGMAMYGDPSDFPAGTDLIFNTNKEDSGNKLDALKDLKVDKLTGKLDKDNPFGAQISRQIVDPLNTDKVTSSMNIVNDEGQWNEWSRNISTQVLSKQSPKLARDQLNMTYENKKQEFDDIMSMTNPTVRRKLLEEFAEGADASAVHLKAAAMPRQRSQVILPVDSISDQQIYAPNFKNGERVALVRYPHGGTFEIPELTVNNHHPDAKRMLGNAKDAVAINSRVAERMSGADFDGDTVLVIPNGDSSNKGRIKSTPALEGLKNFDPKASYPAYEGMKAVAPKEMQTQMGKVSNLITDMTIRGAPQSEIARAVRHSMVVIDSEKHNLDYKSSAIDNGIPALKAKYQGGSNSGATTIISRATSEERINRRKPRPASEGGPIDKATGKKVFVDTGDSYVTKDTVKVNKKTGETTVVPGKKVFNQESIAKLANTSDANTLSSGTPIEQVYVQHSNKLKALANQARKEFVNTPRAKTAPSAKETYAAEVKSLNSKLNLALQNAPLERQAQVLANAVVRQKNESYPTMDKAQQKRVASQALAEARNRTGASKQRVQITQLEWNAIQAGAISDTKLSDILDNADMDIVRELATPRTQKLMTPAKQARAQSMLSAGYSRAEVASALGVSLTTLDNGGESVSE